MTHRAFFERSVTKYKCRRAGLGCSSVNARSAQTHRLPGGRFYDLPLVRIRAQLDHHMKPRRNTPRSQMRQMGAERIHELVATRTIDPPGFPQVAVEFSAIEKVGQCQLIEYRRAA